MSGVTTLEVVLPVPLPLTGLDVFGGLLISPLLLSASFTGLFDFAFSFGAGGLSRFTGLLAATLSLDWAEGFGLGDSATSLICFDKGLPSQVLGFFIGDGVTSKERQAV